MECILKIKNICKSFSNVEVLKNVSFDLRKGEIHGLMGENGAGKSTLMKIISGIYTKNSGEIYFDGQQVDIKEPTDSINLGIQIINQEFNLEYHLTVAENIFLGNYPQKKFGVFIDWKKMNNEAKRILDEIGESFAPDTLVSRLTVAEQQIVEIAKAISHTPSVLIMDEPTAALNDQETKKLFNIIKRMRQNGVSIIIITHRLSEQFEISDRITVLRDGESVKTVNTKETNADEIISLMVGRVISDMYVRNRNQSEKELFAVKNLNISGKIKDVSFNVKSGELVSVFGLMGMGQKELCNALFGNEKNTSADFYIDGKKVAINSPAQAREHGMGLVSDDRRKEGIIPLMNVSDNSTITILKQLVSKIGFIDKKEEREIVNEWIKKLNIRCSSPTQTIRTLSGGNQQKVLIARWLINNTKILILNMPTRGIDVGAKAEIYHLLDQLCATGVGVLIFSYEMPEVLGMSDRVYVLCDGEISGEFSIDDATQEKLMQSAISKYLV